MAFVSLSPTLFCGWDPSPRSWFSFLSFGLHSFWSPWTLRFQAPNFSSGLAKQGPWPLLSVVTTHLTAFFFFQSSLSPWDVLDYGMKGHFSLHVSSVIHGNVVFHNLTFAFGMPLKNPPVSWPGTVLALIQVFIAVKWHHDYDNS